MFASPPTDTLRRLSAPGHISTETSQVKFEPAPPLIHTPSSERHHPLRHHKHHLRDHSAESLVSSEHCVRVHNVEEVEEEGMDENVVTDTLSVSIASSTPKVGGIGQRFRHISFRRNRSGGLELYLLFTLHFTATTPSSPSPLPGA